MELASENTEACEDGADDRMEDSYCELPRLEGKWNEPLKAKSELCRFILRRARVVEESSRYYRAI